LKKKYSRHARDKWVFRNEREVVQTIRARVLFFKEQKIGLGPSPSTCPGRPGGGYATNSNLSSIFNRNNFLSYFIYLLIKL
jgi:hypothetical protein